MTIKDRNEAGMKKRVLSIVLFTVILFCCTSAVCEHNAEIQITASSDEWSWDPGAYNQFSGKIDLSEFCGREITIKMTTDLSYGGDPDEDHSPLFTVVNGPCSSHSRRHSSSPYNGFFRPRT